MLRLEKMIRMNSMHHLKQVKDVFCIQELIRFGMMKQTVSKFGMTKQTAVTLQEGA